VLLEQCAGEHARRSAERPGRSSGDLEDELPVTKHGIEFTCGRPGAPPGLQRQRNELSRLAKSASIRQDRALPRIQDLQNPCR